MTKQELDRAVRVIEESPLAAERAKITKLYRIIEERDQRIVNLEMERRKPDYDGSDFEMPDEKWETKQWSNLPIREWKESKIPPYEGEKEPDDRIAESLADHAPRVIIWLFSGIIIGMVITWIIWAITN